MVLGSWVGWGGLVLVRATKTFRPFWARWKRWTAVDVENRGDCIVDFLNYIVMVDVSRALTNRGEDGCKGCTNQSGHHEHRLGRHFGLLYSRRVTWQENHGSPWPSKIGIRWCYFRDNHYILTLILRRLFFLRGILLLSCLLSSFPIKTSKLVSSTSTFGSFSTPSPSFASGISGIFRAFCVSQEMAWSWPLVSCFGCFFQQFFGIWLFTMRALLGFWAFFSYMSFLPTVGTILFDPTPTEFGRSSKDAISLN